MSDDDLILDDDWAPEDGAGVAAGAAPGKLAPLADLHPWRVLIVDDDEDIHSVTRLSLGNIVFKGRSLELISAYSGEEAYKILSQERDIAMILLDVVMESEDSGLRLVHRIRGELDNQLVRIVLRTGQPGQAPEQKVIVDYDINDYKTKTELTNQRLFTTVVASLRAYESLLSLERSRDGLNKILQGSANLYELKSLKEFASGVLHQIGAILDVGADGVLCVSRGNDSSGKSVWRPAVIAATGSYADLAREVLLPEDYPWLPLVRQAFAEKRSLFQHPADVLFIHTKHGHEFAVLMTPPWPLAQLQRDLLALFCDRIAVAFDNLHLHQQLQKAQEASVVALADLAESRDTDTGGHVQRVCKLTEAIARELKVRNHYPQELTPQFLDMVGIASILHDVGKVATPDAVLLKPGSHNPSERNIMEDHAIAGEKVLARASQMVEGVSYLTYGAQIAGGHHEHFDGQGYPRHLKGESIPLAARIVAVVDVFDALLHRRAYKAPWALPDVLSYIEQRKGSQFDPLVVEALLHFVRTENPEWIEGEGH
jgi:response regulator RpfG family c-di-GMP phosphodiesterase